MYTAIKILTATLLTVAIHFTCCSQNLKREAIIVPNSIGNLVHLAPPLKFYNGSEYQVSIDINWLTKEDSVTVFLSYRNDNHLIISDVTFFIKNQTVRKPTLLVSAYNKGRKNYYRVLVRLSYKEIQQFLTSEEKAQFAFHFKNGTFHNFTHEEILWGQKRTRYQKIFQELDLLKLN